MLGNVFAGIWVTMEDEGVVKDDVKMEADEGSEVEISVEEKTNCSS